MKKLLLSLWEILEVALIAAVTVFLIRSFLVQPFLVSGASMEPNFSDGNYLLVDEITYRFRDPERGEVVIFRYPLDKSVFFIKRIIGIPGDKIEIKDGNVFVNDIQIEEDYLNGENKGNTKTYFSSFSEFLVPEDQYFLLGAGLFF